MQAPPSLHYVATSLVKNLRAILPYPPIGSVGSQIIHNCLYYPYILDFACWDKVAMEDGSSWCMGIG